jgi:hypothetical protein
MNRVTQINYRLNGYEVISLVKHNESLLDALTKLKNKGALVLRIRSWWA